MQLGSFEWYRGFRIDCCLKSRGCYKVRIPSGDGYYLMDFASVTAAKRFICSLER